MKDCFGYSPFNHTTGRVDHHQLGDSRGERLWCLFFVSGQPLVMVFRERCWSGCSFERGTIWRPLTNPQLIMIGWVSEECKFPCKKIHQKNFLAVCKFLKSFSVVLWKKHVATGKHSVPGYLIFRQLRLVLGIKLRENSRQLVFQLVPKVCCFFCATKMWIPFAPDFSIF